jgi:hypothetical protein
MKDTNWKDIAELIGIAAIVMSLVFVGQEIRQSREIARLEWTGILAAEQMALDDLLGSEAEVWRKGCEGSELSPTELTVFVRQFSSFHHFAFARWVRANVGVTGANPLFVSKEYAKNIHRFPGFREMWGSWKSSRIEVEAPLEDGILGFPEEVDSWIPVLQQEEPESSFDASMCGTWAP